MRFTNMELLLLRRLIVNDIDVQERRIARYKRFCNPDEFFQAKMAVAQTELTAMLSILKSIDEEITVRDLFSIIT